MLHEFVFDNRLKIVDYCRAKGAVRPAPRLPDVNLEIAVPLFLDQIIDTLRFVESPRKALVEAVAKRGATMLHPGFNISRVIAEYGDVCQAIIQLAVERSIPITNAECNALVGCLDEAIAEAVAEYARRREMEGIERVGRLVHELRGLLHSAMLAFELLKSECACVDGSTTAVLGRSLASLRALVDREFTDVRLTSNVLNKEPLAVRALVEELELSARLDLHSRELVLSVEPVADHLVIHADREVMLSVVSNLLRNAFKFTRRGGQVVLRAFAREERVRIEVEDQCGGLPPGRIDELFRPFEQRGVDRTGLGLGLSICRRGALLHDGTVDARNLEGVGCVFGVDLPRSQPALHA